MGLQGKKEKSVVTRPDAILGLLIADLLSRSTFVLIPQAREESVSATDWLPFWKEMLTIRMETITSENTFLAFVMERHINSPRFSFVPKIRICEVMSWGVYPGLLKFGAPECPSNVLRAFLCLSPPIRGTLYRILPTFGLEGPRDSCKGEVNFFLELMMAPRLFADNQTS